MEKNSIIDLSVIIPVYNVEDYLHECVDSIISQTGVSLEIILVNDGSTDNSGAIADQYAQKDNRIKVIHQENGEASAARNAGLNIAQGHYIAFIDSDDWIKKDSLSKLYREAIKFDADIVMSKVEFGHIDGSMNYYKPVPDELKNIPFAGKEAFVQLMKTGSYRPMVWNYIYRRSFLEEIQMRFVVGITPHEDELWMPVALCQAPKVVISDVEHYFYRQREESVLYSTNLKKRLTAYIRVTDLLFEFTNRYDFSGADGEVKGWMYVNIFHRLQWAFGFLTKMKDSSYTLPAHQTDRYWKECWEMTPEPQKGCDYHFRRAEKWLKRYTDWRTSEWVASVKSQWESGKKMMLLYNIKSGLDLSLRKEDVPNDWIITTDRRFLEQADVVVFHLPYLLQDLENDDTIKPENQIWVGWFMEAEINYPMLKNPEVSEPFDIWMSYRNDAELVYPFYKYNYLDSFNQKFLMHSQRNKTGMIFSDLSQEKSSCDYLGKLKEYIEVDTIYIDPVDVGQINLKQYYQNYKFVLAFENAIDTDFVTEKFYDPLLAGSVPVYLGAPNIEDFAPGDNCFVDVRQFENPQSLAGFIQACYEDEGLYAQFFEWKNHPLRPSFLQKIEEQKEHPLVRLCRKVDEMKTNTP